LIRALLFDFDGVLAFTTPTHYLAWQQVLRPHGLAPDELVMRLNEGAPAYRLAQALAKHAGQELDDGTAQQYVEEKNRLFRQMCHDRPFAEIETLLNGCDRKGWACAVVTGTTLANLRHVLDEPLLQRFQAIIKEGDYQNGKPHPEPFLRAAAQLGVPAASCVVIENAPFGIQAAKAAGMFCIGLTTTLAAEHLHQADVILESHAQLIKYLETLAL